jgi:homogentisate 1,2-dioxygenase
MDAPMTHFFRNADCDEVHFVHEGRGVLETDYGPLAYAPGDYIVLPRATTHRFVPVEPTWTLVTESRGEVSVPERGMLGQHAIFDPAVLVVPTPAPSMLHPDTRGEWEVCIRRDGHITRVYYPFQPLNVVGWKGTTAACLLHVRDIRPVLSDRYHVPPSAHTTFVMPGAVICTFAPRPLENGDPAALKVPFYHSNVDYDEVIFYHAGEFFSREGIRPGMLTFHPQGIHHGPQPRAVGRSAEARATEEIAVMLDTRRPLRVLEAMTPAEHADYWKSWRSA